MKLIPLFDEIFSKTKEVFINKFRKEIPNLQTKPFFNII